MLDHLKSVADKSQLLSYKTFIQEVLYAPKIGYYTQERKRVGRNPTTDFYTAESLGPVFQKLILASIQTLLKNQPLNQFTFVEIGAEPHQSLFQNSDHPFLNTLTLRPHQSLEIPPKSIVFANELLDAQPFHRLIYQNNQWHELGVQIHPNNTLSETTLPTLSPEVKNIANQLPQNAPENYQLDLPLEAENLLKKIASQNWQGLLLLFDYGFLWEDLIHNHPQGTARAYHNHKQLNNLLANPGNQDITCHICWDRLIPILKQHHFSHPTLQKQESFFIHHAPSAIEEIIQPKEKNKFNHPKQTLQEIIHPAHMGHKFQVLWGLR